MTTTTTPVFEREMRNQIAAAEAAVADATTGGDPLLVDAAQGHLDGLLDLARRNGLEINLLDVTEPEPVVIDIAEQPAAP